MSTALAFASQALLVRNAKKLVLLELTAKTVLSDASARTELNAFQKLVNVSANQDGMASSASDLVRFTLTVKAAQKPANA